MTILNHEKRRRRRRARSYPIHELQNSLEVASAIHKEGISGSINTVRLSGILRTTPDSSAYVMRLTSARKYGLTEGNSRSENIILTDRGRSAVAPSRPEEQRRALIEAALEPSLFYKFYDAYDGQKLPTDEMATNLLQRDFGIGSSLIQECLDVIKSNGYFVGLLGEVGRDVYVSTSGAHSSAKPAELFPEKDPIDLVTERKVQSNSIFVGHLGCPDIIRYIEPFLSSFGISFHSFEFGVAFPLTEIASIEVAACNSAVIVYAKNDKFSFENSNGFNKSRESMINLVGAVSALYGNRILLLRERGLDRLFQEDTIPTVEFTGTSMEELGLALLQSLHSMDIIEIHA